MHLTHSNKRMLFNKDQYYNIKNDGRDVLQRIEGLWKTSREREREREQGRGGKP